jgi:hypothetical protein
MSQWRPSKALIARCNSALADQQDLEPVRPVLVPELLIPGGHAGLVARSSVLAIAVADSVCSGRWAKQASTRSRS